MHKVLSIYKYNYLSAHVTCLPIHPGKYFSIYIRFTFIKSLSFCRSNFEREFVQLPTEVHITYNEMLNSNLITLAVRKTLPLQIHSYPSTLTKSAPCVSYVIIAATYTKRGHKLGALDSRDITPDSVPLSQGFYGINSIIPVTF
jgi:hypothetical protein